MSENTPSFSVDPLAELRQRQSEPAQSLLRYCPRNGIYGTTVEPPALIRVGGPTLPACGVYKPALCIIARGRKEVQLAEERHIYDSLYYLVVSVILPLTGQVIDVSLDAPCLRVRLDTDSAEIIQLIFDAGPTEVASRRGDRGLYVDRIDASLLDVVPRLIHLLDSPCDIPMLVPPILRKIFYRLLRSDQGQRLHEIAIADSQAHRITRVIDWINQNYGKPLRIEQLVQVVNLSPSTLHHRFRVVTVISPLQYQKQLRLQEARRLIFSEGLEVAAVGYRVGYESPSQFSCEYSRLFGVPPLRDLAWARNTTQGNVAAAATVNREVAAYLRRPNRPCVTVPAMIRALLLLLLVLPLPAVATDSKSLARRYLIYIRAIGQHNERLWPGWRMVDKAFLYNNGRSTWVTDAKGRAQRITAAGDSDPALDLNYVFPYYRGRPAVLLQISTAYLRSNTGNSETLAVIGPHEVFHRYAQEDWSGLCEPGGYRGDLATLDPCPREYRYVLFQSLLQALYTPGQRDSYLGDAQGWPRRWHEAAPGESRLTMQVDLSKGTARYIEMVAVACYRSDFAEDPQRYRQALREHALAFYDADKTGVGADSKAYEIGALAGVLLDLYDDDVD